MWPFSRTQTPTPAKFEVTYLICDIVNGREFIVKAGIQEAGPDRFRPWVSLPSLSHNFKFFPTSSPMTRERAERVARLLGQAQEITMLLSKDQMAEDLQ